jgi:hypothetical protein
MSLFMDAPITTLHTLDDLAAAVNHPELWYTGSARYQVRSVVLCDLIRTIKAEGQYPYNAIVARRARAMLGLPSLSEAEQAKEGNPLSALVYNAQNYTHSDDLKAAGFEPFTRELAELAFKAGAKLRIDGRDCTVKKLPDGRLAAFAPYRRNRCYLPHDDTAVKLVQPTKKAKPNVGAAVAA